MTDQVEFRIRYWGTRGSFPSPLRPHQVTDKIVESLRRLHEQDILRGLIKLEPDPAFLRQLVEEHLPCHCRSTYGGNTTCIEIRTPDALLIVDAGSGMIDLGRELTRRWKDAAPASRTVHLLLTHVHMDHVQAAPFVHPIYDPQNRFSIWGPQSVIDMSDAILDPDSSLQGLLFPPSLDQLQGIKAIHSISAGERFRIEGTAIDTYPLVHPGGCLAYRFERGGRVVVIASDHEHTDGPDDELAEFSQGADLLYLDAQYLPDEYAGLAALGDEPPISRKGWGHSTVDACIATAIAAGVKRLHLGHHDPARDDRSLAELECYAQQLAHDTLARHNRSPDDCKVNVAYEGLAIDI